MDINYLAKLSTEGRNLNSMNIDSVSTLKMIELINEEDMKVAIAVKKAKEHIANAVDIIAERLYRGGRLIYVGAGTSGRLGILDASECPPTYGVDAELVQGIIAGGPTAVFKAVEGAEDDAEQGKKDLIAKGVNAKDVVCGIAASGRTPYVIGAMNYGKEAGAAVISLTMSEGSEMSKLADVPIEVIVGPEVIMGSTRMKSGTAQKMVLNMLSTGAMIKLGKVYGNLMVDVQTSNEKLRVRANRIVKLATQADDETVEKKLQETKQNVKLAIILIKTGLSVEEGRKLLSEHNGIIAKALEEFEYKKD
jgi:N-acetylmuramic acid 6-phosphate etherase